MTRWHDRFIALAGHVAGWSRDPSTQVGAVIIDSDKRVVSLGYNGPPKGTNDAAALVSRDTRLARTLHAEENAILFAGVRGGLGGCSMYTTHHPCAHCAAVIIQSGLKTVYVPPTDAKFSERWYAGIVEAQRMFQEAGVTVITVWPDAT